MSPSPPKPAKADKDANRAKVEALREALRQSRNQTNEEVRQFQRKASSVKRA